MKTTNIILGILILLMTGAGFLAIIKYQENKTASFLGEKLQNQTETKNSVNVSTSPEFPNTGDSDSSPTASAAMREVIVEGSNYKFNPDLITVNKGGKVKILFKNIEGYHDFKIDELGVAIPAISEGKESFVEFTPDKIGEFEFYCSIGNHRQMGMKGILKVE